jgi:phosphatidylglycerophosphatase A
MVVNPTFSDLCRSPSLLLAFGFGSGLSPKAPGTMGTLAAVPLYLLLSQLPLWLYLAIVIAGFGLGVVICSQASKLLQVHDHGGIVWDEIIGYWLTMVLAPPGWWWIVAGFVLFRVFDILKPWPISIADKKISGGFGIMIDDVLAAVYALICLQFAAWLLIGYKVFEWA